MRPTLISRPLAIVIDRQHLAADRLGGVGGEEHRERGDVFRVDHRLNRLLGHRRGAHLLDRPAADLGAAGEDAIASYSAAAISVRGVTIVTMASALSSTNSGSRLSCSNVRGARMTSPSAFINAKCAASASAALATASSNVSPAAIQPGTSGKLTP